MRKFVKENRPIDAGDLEDPSFFPLRKFGSTYSQSSLVKAHLDKDKGQTKSAQQEEDDSLAPVTTVFGPNPGSCS